MRSNRTVTLACVCAMALMLAACHKKEEAAPDAAPEAAVSAAAAASAPTDVAVDAATPLSTTAVAAKAAAAPIKAGDGGAADAAVAVADAGPAVDQCCCEVAGQPLASVGQSECVKTRKGQCVKKERCGADTSAQTCCCDSGGKKDLVGQSECTKGKGKCVKMTDCKK